MIVLGIDPGIAICGVVGVKDIKGKQTLIFSKEITTPSHTSSSSRLVTIYNELTGILKEVHPDAVAIEKLFFNTNTKTALIVGEARGVIELAVCQHGTHIFEYTPLEVKMSLTGYGRADKNQIQQMIKSILKLPAILKPDDVADAAAIALTHCFSYKMKQSTKK
ncbi:crossover junction endodeoxyribonuclease RuvC [Candidatus Gottesmanbacteria bacterium RIFCSPHIGHO2_02_FULL_39_11]|uniref:Crossover junction endodeoxyribonuclease RuvC n=1 Tax=Candidatus Gottesmanbacteria bacterium RIFCSPHIGHO2_02_FULL_39_11 TaxID=1798382 RepID=A0A1F5ZLH1_9BACT|nr:MAG: crossover junction endodeoxyribonuclease RuvC [Candidatus Gottesmanbacteria bacterium RIFCSPHIGHO2_02_FULL_39_11]